ncbi:efflux RND transporter permease subunit [Desulfogranum japonicum]|uniref:efflux RND transporter permease subunit n=1 Tax=Desulfogranum japonicum TaxID=231447 RepID=UPI0004097327|nr:efflux RND transporter permease subunit [Desulfogranum japonicum]
MNSSGKLRGGDGYGIIGWFVENPIAANLLMIVVIVLGVMQAANLQRESFPSTEPNSITISVSYDSGSAQQAEEGIAMKIEDQLEGVNGIKNLTSASTASGATVTVEKLDDYNLETLLDDVKDKIDAISTFPADAKNPVISKSQREEHAIWVQLYGEADRATLQNLAYRLKLDLLSNSYVSQVNTAGWIDPMMVIEIDEGKLQAYGLSLSDVESAVNATSSDTMSAVLNGDNVYLQLKSSSQAYYKTEFAAIPLLTTNNGHQVLLGDVAEVADLFDDSTSVLSRFNGVNSVALQVIASDDDDITETVSGALEVITEWRDGGKLPTGVELATWHDHSINIKQRLALLGKNAFSGIVLVFVLLAACLNLTVAFWVAMGLPFIFFGTLYFMGIPCIDLTLNEFTTFGFIMALGIVVDDAVVIGESVYTVRRGEGDTKASTIKGTMLVAVPTLFGVFTTVAAFYSLTQLSGRLGQLYSQFATVVTVCLLLSLIESKLILPAHLSHLNTRRSKIGNPYLALWQKVQVATDFCLEWFNEQIYRRVIECSLSHRYTISILFLVVFVLVVSMPLTGKVRLSFFPDVPGDTINGQLAMQNDASYGQTHAALSQLEQQALQADEDLRGDGAASGIASLQVLSEADRSGKITVELAPDSPYDVKSFTNRWRELAGQPEGARTVSIQSRHNTIDAFRMELRSNDDQELIAAGEWVKTYLLDIPAVSGIEDNLEPGMPQLHIELNQEGRALGLTTDMLSQQIYQAFSGQIVQRYQRNSDEIEVKVRYPESSRGNPADVLMANIRTSDNTVLPLDSVATVTYGYTRDTIDRINGKRAVYVSSDINKEMLSATELVTKVQQELVVQLKRHYPGLDVHFAGEAEQQAETEHSMINMFLMALFIIYVLLAVPLKSYVQPLLIMMAIPFGVVGAILGHWYNNLPLCILSLNGIIALSGVVVNDSLLLVTCFNSLRKENHGSAPEKLIGIACRSRLRAVLLTSCTTYAGLMPLLGEKTRQAQFLIPAAVSLGYGILFATVITLILIPSLLMIQHDVASLMVRIKEKLTTAGQQAKKI